MVAVRNQCRECKLLIISKVFLSGLHNHRGFAKLDAGHPLVRLWLPPSWQITHRDSVSLADVVCCVPTISAPPPWAFSKAGEMVVGSTSLFSSFGYAIDVRKGPVK